MFGWRQRCAPNACSVAEARVRPAWRGRAWDVCPDTLMQIKSCQSRAPCRCSTHMWLSQMRRWWTAMSMHRGGLMHLMASFFFHRITGYGKRVLPEVANVLFTNDQSQMNALHVMVIHGIIGSQSLSNCLARPATVDRLEIKRSVRMIASCQNNVTSRRDQRH